MWYTASYNKSIQMIRNYNKVITEKEYRGVAKELNLLSTESLRCISGLNFIDLVKRVRNYIA